MNKYKSQEKSPQTLKRQEKSAHIKTDSQINRHGTFLQNNDNSQRELVYRLNNIFKDNIEISESDQENSLIIKQLSEDLSREIFAQSIQEEGGGARFSLSHQEIDWLKHHPESDWLNYLIYRYQFKIYPKLYKYRDFPVHLLIEPTSVCNLRCIMCFQVDSSFTKKQYMGHMSWELFVKVVDQARDHSCYAVTLASRGEPTLHPRLGDMLHYLSKSKIMDIKMNTNATSLPEKLCHDILSSGVNELVFSVDAGTKVTYESIRLGGIFEEIVANIQRFNKIREEHYKNSQTTTRISGVKVHENQDEKQMTSFWSNLVDQVTIKRATPRWDSYNNPIIDVPHPCAMLWERMYVWYDGKVNPCDFDYKSYLCVGSAYDMPLRDIWLGEAYQKLRSDHLEKMRKQHMPCDRCPLF